LILPLPVVGGPEMSAAIFAARPEEEQEGNERKDNQMPWFKQINERSHRYPHFNDRRSRFYLVSRGWLTSP
jgi:hypothetical protein